MPIRPGEFAQACLAEHDALSLGPISRFLFTFRARSFAFSPLHWPKPPEGNPCSAPKPSRSLKDHSPLEFWRDESVPSSLSIFSIPPAAGAARQSQAISPLACGLGFQLKRRSSHGSFLGRSSGPLSGASFQSAFLESFLERFSGVLGVPAIVKKRGSPSADARPSFSGAVSSRGFRASGPPRPFREEPQGQ